MNKVRNSAPKCVDASRRRIEIQVHVGAHHRPYEHLSGQHRHEPDSFQWAPYARRCCDHNTPLARGSMTAEAFQWAPYARRCCDSAPTRKWKDGLFQWAPYARRCCDHRRPRQADAVPAGFNGRLTPEGAVTSSSRTGMSCRRLCFNGRLTPEGAVTLTCFLGIAGQRERFQWAPYARRCCDCDDFAAAVNPGASFNGRLTPEGAVTRKGDSCPPLVWRWFQWAPYARRCCDGTRTTRRPTGSRGFQWAPYARRCCDTGGARP